MNGHDWNVATNAIIVLAVIWLLWPPKGTKITDYIPSVEQVRLFVLLCFCFVLSVVLILRTP